VEAFGENGSPSTEHAIHGARDPSADGHHAASKRTRGGGLDEEVRMGGLQRIVHDPEVIAPEYAGKSPLELANGGRVPKRWEPGAQSHGHVHGKSRRVVDAGRDAGR